MFRVLILIITAFYTLPLSAQDRAGRNTPGEWVVDHQRAFGLWDSFCDHRLTNGAREERCYLRYVDVFSPRPNFAAQFLFVTPGPKVEFGMERGTLFRMGGFRIERDGQTTWSAAKPSCLGGRACIYDGKPATWLLGHMTAGGAFIFDFTDRHGQPQALRWDLAPFADALADFQNEATKRGL